MNLNPDDRKNGIQVEHASGLRAVIPNLFSLSRVLLSPFVFFAVRDNSITLIIALAAWVLLSDYLDGLLARRWNAISDTGKILDPLADKLCTAAAAIALTLYGDLPVILALVIIGRDFIIVLFGLAIARKIKHVPGSDMVGKISATAFAIVLLIYIFKLQILYDVAFIGAVLFVAVSSVSYLTRAYRYIFKKV